jgi:acyl carrier protein
MTSTENSLTEEQRILDFVNGSLRPSGEGEPVTDTTLNLVEAGVIDSVGILEMVVFLEDAFGVTVDQESLNPENFSSVSSIAGFVRRSQGGA